MRNQRFMVALGVIFVAGALLACSPIVNQGREYNLVITLDGASRALSDEPITDVPEFDTVSITVTNGASVVVASRTYLTPQAGYTMSVPEGSPYTVTVVATPVRDLSVMVPQISFAKSYSGSETGVTVSAVTGASIIIEISMHESMIILPDSSFGSMNAATSLIDLNPELGSSFSINPWSDFAFDPYGRLYISEGFSGEGLNSTLTRYDNLVVDQMTPNYNLIVDYFDIFIGSLALSSLNGGRLYYTTLAVPFEGQPEARLRYIELYEEILSPSLVGLPEGLVLLLESAPSYSYGFPVEKLPIAVDAAGTLYFKAMDSGVPVIVKLENPTGSQIKTTISYQDLGLIVTNMTLDDTIMNVEDLEVVDGYLYIIANDVSASGSLYDESRSRGKIIKVDTSTMTQVVELGWRTDKLPLQDDTLLFGPRRIVGIAPKKLYILDEGFYYDETGGVYPYNNIKRVNEIDLTTFGISDGGLDGLSNLTMEEYSSIYASYNYVF